MNMKATPKLHLSSRNLLLGIVGIAGLTIQDIVLRIKGSDSDIISHDNESKFLAKVQPAWPSSESQDPTISEITKSILGSYYHNYFAFLLMMLLLHAILQGVTFLKHLLKKEKNQEGRFSWSWSDYLSFKDDKIRQIMISFLKNMMIYSLIYCFYQIVASYCFGISLFLEETSLKTLPRSSRILFEENSRDMSLSMSDQFMYQNDDEARVVKKPSLSIGRVLSELDMQVYSTLLSKDGKTAFVQTEFDALLKIIDISDLESPVILSSRALNLGYYQIRCKAMILSPDQTKLYISNADSLEVFDVSDLRSPVSLGLIQDKTPGDRSDPDAGKLQKDGEARTSLLMSRDNKFLFAAGLGLQIFDISKPAAPVFVSSIRGRFLPSREKFVPTSIDLSADGKTLFYTDGSLWIYDATDPKNLKNLNSFNRTYTITSLKLSKDFKSAYIVGRSGSGGNKIIFEKLDVSDIMAIKENRVIQFEQESSVSPIIIEKSPNDFFLFIQIDGILKGKGERLRLVAFDIDQERFVFHNKMLVSLDGFSVLFTQDGEKVLVGADRKLKIVDLYLNYPNKNSFTEFSNIAQTFDSEVKFDAFTFSEARDDESFFYSFSSTNGYAPFILSKQTFNGKNKRLMNTPLYSAKEKGRELMISTDNKRAYWIAGQSSSKEILIADISDVNKVTVLSQYEKENSRFNTLQYFAFSKDGKIGYLSYAYNNLAERTKYNLVEITDFSDPQNPVKKASIQVENDSGCVRLSKDESLLFISGQVLVIYNVMDPSSPTLLAKIPLQAGTMNLARNEMLFSNDEKTLFIKEGSGYILNTVRIIDVSNLTSPKVLSDFRLPMSSKGPSYDGHAMALSPDSKTLYLMRDFDIIAADVSNPASPRYLGAIRTGITEQMADFRLNGDGMKAYIGTKQGKLHAVNVKPVYSTLLVQDTLLLGERYSMDLMVLKYDREKMDYNAIDAEYRFMKFMMVESKSVQGADFATYTLKMVPSWINFDFKTQTLTVEARRKNDIKSFTIYCAFSTRIPKAIFDDEVLVEGPEESEDLIATLISLGYLDNQLFLTENFGSYDEFILPNQHSTIKERVYKLLKQFSYETFNQVKIVQSLGLKYQKPPLKDEKKLVISTPNPASVKVDISLKPKNPAEAQFLSRNYGSLLPIILEDKTRISIDGTLEDVNLALQEMVVNLENITSCPGEITVNDKMNPVMIQSLENISGLFEKNVKPGVNKNYNLSLQTQVETSPVYTGQYFQIKLSEKTFSDHYISSEKLTSQVVLVKKDGSVGQLPTWISFSDLTLTGTAPEIATGRDFELKIIVSNEFKSFEHPFELHVNISAAFAVKLLMKYAPYLLSMLAMLIKMNKIYNIVLKVLYQHPKNFHVRVGEEVAAEKIFPISFIAQETQEMKKILTEMRKEIAFESSVKSIKNDKLLSYFLIQRGNEKVLDKERLMEKMKEWLNMLPSQDKAMLDLYFNGSKYQKYIIQELVINWFINEQLKLKEEIETRKCFERIKKRWPEFIDWDSSTSRFKIFNEEIFVQLSQETEVSSSSQKDKDEILDLTASSSSDLLINSSGKINMELLKNAVLGYAFDCQNIEVLPVNALFQVKEKAEGAALWKRFLKLDLGKVSFQGSDNIGYGINFTKKYNTLYFHGVIAEDFRGKTLVFQVTDLKEKILKEIWIECVYEKKSNYEETERDQRSFYNSNELEARGKDYEAF